MVVGLFQPGRRTLPVGSTGGACSAAAVLLKMAACTTVSFEVAAGPLRNSTVPLQMNPVEWSLLGVHSSRADQRFFAATLATRLFMPSLAVHVSRAFINATLTLMPETNAARSTS